MQEVMVPKERHTKLIFPLVFVFILLSASGFYMIASNTRVEESKEPVDTAPVVTKSDSVTEGTLVDKATSENNTDEFVEIPEDEDTPVEIDNDALDELDSIMNYIDNTSVSDDLSDLE